MRDITFILLFLSIVLSVSCSKEMEEGADVPEGKVEVRFSVPSLYDGIGPAGMTKALDSEFLDGKMIERLPVGATIWLSYAKKTGDDAYEKAVVKPYIVKSTEDYVGLYPCGIEEYTDGNSVEWLRINPEKEEAPLYLDMNETYNFKVLYPAHDLKKEDLKFNIYNGRWACTNDPRYAQTVSKDITLTAGSQKVSYIELNPMVNQTARIHFEIAKGDNVHTLEMMHNGIEISGVQDKNTTHLLDWTLDEYMEVMQMESIDDGEHWYKLQTFEVKDDKIIGDAYILPLDVRRTYIFILINMAVNGIPTQYVLTLNGIILEHARSYDFDLKAGIDGNLTVVNWQNTSLTVKPEVQ